jgi:glycerate 2-kinase
MISKRLIQSAGDRENKTTGSIDYNVPIIARIPWTIQMNELIAESIAAALNAANPYQAIHRHLHREGDTIEIEHRHYGLTCGDIRCMAIGKGAVPMAQAVADLLGDKISTGLVVTKYEHLGSAKFPPDWEVIEAGHPHPDEQSLAAGDRVWHLLAECTELTLIITCISGGASALVAAPQPWSSLQQLCANGDEFAMINAALVSQGIDISHPSGKFISLAALQAINSALLNSGLDIEQINAVRSKLDRLKAGGLVRHALPGRVIGLILSDVIGDPIGSIGSGMTNHPHAHNTLVGNNRQSCLAVAEAAKNLGYEPQIITTSWAGDAQARGREIAREIVTRSPKTVLIYGGETTVTLPPNCQGKGGRNQELALAAAIELGTQSTPAWVVTLATDGTDGPTDAAGATVNEQTIARSIELGLDANLALDRHDSYPFFQRLGDLRLLGATGTNVADITIAIRP